MLRPDGNHDINATHVRESKIHQRYVWPVLAKLLNRLLTIRCFGDQFHIWLAIDKRSDAFAQQVMIIRAQNSDRFDLAHFFLSFPSSNLKRSSRSNCLIPHVCSTRSNAISAGIESATSVPAPARLK